MNQAQMLMQLKKELENEQGRLSAVQALMGARRAVTCPRDGAGCAVPSSLGCQSLSDTGGLLGKAIANANSLIALLSLLPFEPGGG